MARVAQAGRGSGRKSRHHLQPPNQLDRPIRPLDRTGGTLVGGEGEQNAFVDALDIVRAIDAFAAEPNGGLIMVPTSRTAANRALINRLAMKYRLPTIHPYGEGVSEGGLIAYGSNN